ncbi:10 kDa chaperonin 2, chloroplastic [Stylosanthes scabra]|uniref:10 kDa chaperonin 2, chloroplastic n=1 Tax=Stylosanthes scabra TaxID=79078 RepID=A0ABU6R4W2_9FABA|nr:10 kDa chaperonin 2, chloroplastic [Stylosanthes scabra]
MASTFITLPTPFLHKTTSFSFPNNQFPVLKRNSLKVNALVSNKWEPTKVVPQADRVLIRLEQLPDVLSVGAEAEQIKAGSKVLFTDMNAYEVDLGTDEKHCFCKASDLLAVVE